MILLSIQTQFSTVYISHLHLRRKKNSQVWSAGVVQKTKNHYLSNFIVTYCFWSPQLESLHYQLIPSQRICLQNSSSNDKNCYSCLVSCKSMLCAKGVDITEICQWVPIPLFFYHSQSKKVENLKSKLNIKPLKKRHNTHTAFRNQSYLLLFPCVFC